MTSVLSTLGTPDVATSPAARFRSVGRLAAAGTLVLGAAFQLASFLIIPSHDETLERLTWVADHASRAELSKAFDILAMPFLLGTAVVYVLLARDRSPRLAWAGGILLALGMVGLSMIQGVETLEFAVATDGRIELATFAEVVDDLSTVPAGVIFVMFIGGVLFGLLVSTVALWRSRAVPRGAVLLIPLFIVVDVFLGRPVEGHVISFAAALWLAAAVLQAGRADAEAQRLES